MEEAVMTTPTRQRVAVIEVLDRDGSVRQAWPVNQWPVTIGRSVQCDVVLDDPHIAAEHARLQFSGEAPMLEALPSINGVQIQSKTIDPGKLAALDAQGEWQMGQSHLRIRLASETLAPELPLSGQGSITWWLLLSVWLAIAAGFAFEVYASTNIDGFWQHLLSSSVPSAVYIVLWTSGWALASRIFQKHLFYKQHFWIVGVVVLIVGALDWMLSAMAYVTSLEWLGRMTPFVYVVMLGLMVWHHSLLVHPRKPHKAKWVGLLASTLMLCLILIPDWISTGRLPGGLYMSSLYPPSMRLAPTHSIDDFLKNVAEIEPVLREKAREISNPLLDLSSDDD